MTAPAPTPPAPANPAPPAGSPPQPEQSFTQDDVNRIVAERLARESRKYEGYDEFKAKAEKFDEIEAQNATELEKATKKAADDARADMTATTNTRLVRAEVKAAAAAANFHDPGDAATLLADRFTSVKVDDHGEVDDAAVKALVEELAKAKPHLVKTANGGPRPLPGQGTPPAESVSGKDAGLAEARRRFGEPKTTT